MLAQRRWRYHVQGSGYYMKHMLIVDELCDHKNECVFTSNAT